MAASFLLLVGGFSVASAPALAQAAHEPLVGDDAKDESDSELAKQIQNPVGDLISFPLQNNVNFGYGPHGGTQNVLNLQPVIPFHVTDDWNVITRSILPVVWSQNAAPVPTVPVGTGPVSFSAFLSPRHDVNGWLWGAGPVVQLPTISSTTLGSSVWGAGPSAAIVYSSGPWVAGALVNAVWSLGGTSGPSGNGYGSFLANPFVAFNFDDGWYVSTGPNVTANWQFAGTNGRSRSAAAAGGSSEFGALPVDLALSAYYNVVKPHDRGRAGSSARSSRSCSDRAGARERRRWQMGSQIAIGVAIIASLPGSLA